MGLNLVFLCAKVELSIQNSTLITTDGAMIKLTNPSKLNDLGWKHKVELEDGISMMYKWYLGNNK